MGDGLHPDRSFAGSEPEGARQVVERPGDRIDRLLDWGQVQKITGMSRTTAWRMQKTGDFPEPVPISPNRVAWLESDLAAWTAERKAAGRTRPRALAPPRAPRLIETARSAKAAPSRTPVETRPALPASAAEDGAAGGPPQVVPQAVSQAVTGRIGADAQDVLRPATGMSSEAPVRRRGRKGGVSPDQIDFGF